MIENKLNVNLGRRNRGAGCLGRWRFPSEPPTRWPSALLSSIAEAGRRQTLGSSSVLTVFNQHGFSPMSKRKSWWLFPRHLSSHVRPHCNVQCQSTFEVGRHLVDIFSLSVIRDSIMWTGIEWHREIFATFLRASPPGVDWMLGQLKSQRQIQLTCLSSSLLVLFPDVSRLWTSWQHNACSKVDMNINLKLKVSFWKKSVSRVWAYHWRLISGLRQIWIR